MYHLPNKNIYKSHFFPWKTSIDSIDLTNYSLSKSKNNKYNLLSYVTKENNKYNAYIKNNKGIWCKYNDENIIKDTALIVDNDCIPYIVIYEKEI